MLERMAARPLPLLLLICAVSFGFMLGGHSLWDVDEPNNAVCAREMLMAGNWWVPVFNGGLRFDKPILLYWLMMPLFSFFGVHEWTARLPSALAATALIAAVWYFGRRMVDARTGLIAALLLATGLHMVVIGRAATPDPLLMLCVGVSLLAFLCFYLEGLRNQRLLTAAYAMLGLGMLAKGPVAVLLPALIIPCFLLLMGRWHDAGKFRPLLGLCIILAVALPWYVAVGVLTDGEWLRGFLLHHNIDRFTHVLQGHRGFPGFYLLTFWLGWFPWSGLLFAALVFGSWRLASLRQEPVRLFLLCWMGVFFVFFTAAGTRLPNYMLPAFPAAAILMADWMSKVDEKKVQHWLVYTALILSVALTLGGAWALANQWPGEWMYSLCFAPLVLAAAAGLGMRLDHAMAAVAAGMLGCVILLASWVLPGLDHHKVSPRLATAADKAGFDGSRLATYRYFQPSLLFYHGGRLPRLGNRREVAAWLTQGKAVVMPEIALEDFPSAILPYLIVHDRVYGLYARKWLLLVSLRPVEGE